MKYFLLDLQRYIFHRPVRTRAHLPILTAILGLRGTGVEVGVMRGGSSEFIIKYSTLSEVYSVDPWKKFSDSVYFDSANVSQEQQEQRYEHARKLLARYKEKSKILRMDSIEAAKLFQSESLDFVYIDANHSYEACKRDLEVWWPKVKRGGIFAGHDYMIAESWNCKVKEAVDEFMDKYNQKLFIIPGSYPSWYVVKRT